MTAGGGEEPLKGAAASPPEHRFALNWPRWVARVLKISARLVQLRLIGCPDFSASRPAIFALWHEDDFSTLPYFRRAGGDILVSPSRPSRDGSILSQAVEVLGYRAVRGSSSRGGLGGLLALKKSLENGRNVIFAADGPKGPRQVAKPGPVYLAAKTGRPIYPLATACDRAYIFKKSWHQTRLPLPGARLVAVFGPPLHIPEEGARWPALQQSRLMTAAISEAARAARLELDSWLRK